MEWFDDRSFFVGLGAGIVAMVLFDFYLSWRNRYQGVEVKVIRRKE
jgi:hypothetical protein